MSTFNVDTTKQSNLSVAYTSSGLNITAIGLPAGTHLGKPLLPVTVSPFNLLIALNSHFSETVNLTITSVDPSDANTFTINACTKPVLGSPSATGMIDTTTSQTITIAQTAQTVGYDWTVNGIPPGVTGAGSATKGPSDLYTLSIPANTSFASTSVTVTATSNLVSSFISSQTFSISAVVKPVLYAIRPQRFDTTSTVTGPTASVTSPSTMNTTAYPITWTVSGGTGVSINSSTGVISVSASSINNAVTITVTATNGAGSSSTTFTLNSAPFPVINAVTTSSSVIQVSISGTTIVGSASLTNAAAGPVTWSISPNPTGMTFDSSQNIVYSARAIVRTTTYTITATNAAGTGSTTVTVGKTYYIETASGSVTASEQSVIILVGGGGSGSAPSGDHQGIGGGGGGTLLDGGLGGTTSFTISDGTVNWNGMYATPGGTDGSGGNTYDLYTINYGAPGGNNNGSTIPVGVGAGGGGGATAGVNGQQSAYPNGGTATFGNLGVGGPGFETPYGFTVGGGGGGGGATKVSSSDVIGLAGTGGGVGGRGATKDPGVSPAAQSGGYGGGGGGGGYFANGGSLITPGKGGAACVIIGGLN